MKKEPLLSDWIIPSYENIEENWVVVEHKNVDVECPSFGCSNFCSGSCNKLTKTWTIIDGLDKNTVDIYKAAMKLYYDDELCGKHQAFELFKLIANNNTNDVLYIESCFMVGWMYLNEIGTTYSLELAEKYLKIASDKDHLVAIYGLGLCYYSMEPPNLILGNKYLGIAANKGFCKAVKLLEDMITNPIDSLIIKSGHYYKII